MRSIFRLRWFFPALILLFLQFSIRSEILGQDAKPPDLDTQLAAADQLYRAGKFAEAETSYQALLKNTASNGAVSKNDPKLVPAEVGVVRSMLRRQKIDEAFEAVNDALASYPDAAALLAAKGDVQFRLASMYDAEASYLAAKKLDPKEVHAYLGLARVYRAYSMYRIAYGELKIAHDIAPGNPEVRAAWQSTLTRKEKLAAIEANLRGPLSEEERRQLTEQLEFLKATIDKPLHSCTLVSNVERTETKLETMVVETGRRRWGLAGSQGIGLPAKINDQDVHLELDTGASGIILSHRVGENAGLTRISTIHFGGIGDQGGQNGYIAVVDHIRIGELEFQDCLVTVSNQNSVANQDGLIGADVFASYLVDIDLPGMWLKLSPLPQRPEDSVAPKSLNSEGVEQDSAAEKNLPAGSHPVDFLPKDRYVAPEMANWTKVFRFGHMIMVPTNVNDSKPFLFGLDTGASSNVLSLRAGQQMGKVGADNFERIRGLSGRVQNVYSTKANLRFGGLREPNQDIITFDLETISSEMGTEISGFLGYDMLRQLELKLDYRDGLVEFEYDRKRRQ
jgi:tetratricopeptide (TPR) repeat protein